MTIRRLLRCWTTAGLFCRSLRPDGKHRDHGAYADDNPGMVRAERILFTRSERNEIFRVEGMPIIPASVSIVAQETISLHLSDSHHLRGLLPCTASSLTICPSLNRTIRLL